MRHLPAIGAAALSVAASCPACEAILGTETRVRAALASLERGFQVPIAGGDAVAVHRASFREVTVAEDAVGPLAIALVDADGACAAVRVRYLGVETIRFERRAGTLKAAAPVLPRLAAVAGSLQDRVRAFAARDPFAYRDRLVARSFREGGMDRAAYLLRLERDFAAAAGPPVRLTVDAWTVRIDRDRAEVLEEFRPPVGDPASASPPGPNEFGPGRAPARARFELVVEDGAWRFASGLR